MIYIVKNKRAKETLELTEAEFKKQFTKEIQTAYESFKRSEQNKPYFKLNKGSESDFYFSLQFNFNNYTNSNWYIEKIR